MMNHASTTAEVDPADVGLYVEERPDLRLSDLAAMVEAGESVVRSCHIGNWSLYNCAVARTGATMVVYDRTVPQQDKNYYPGNQIVGEQATRVVGKRDERNLTTHISTAARLGDAPAGTPLVDAHMNAVREALPEANILTMTEYLGNHAAQVQEVVECLVANGFDQGWNRRVEPDGSLREVSGDLAQQIGQYGVFRLSEGAEQSGLLLPNTYNVLLFAVLEALDHNTDTVTHLSGPDMIVYIKDMAHELHSMYQTIVANTSFGQQLPRQLHFQIAPTAHAKFVAPSDKRRELDALLDAYNQWANATRGEHVPGWDQEAALGRTAIEAAIRGYRDPISPARMPIYLTHHDVRAARERVGDSGLYIPDTIWNMTFEDQAQMLADLRWLLA